MLPKKSLRVIRRKELLAHKGGCNAQLHVEINRGLWPPPFDMGPRTRAWFEYEADLVIAARAAGMSDDEIREVVRQILEMRAQLRAEVEQALAVA